MHMSVEVITLVCLMAVLLYFPISWLLSVLRVESKRTQRIGALVIAIGISPFIYGGIISAWVYSTSIYPTETFNKEKWATNSEKRYKMVEDIIESDLLEGKTIEEVIVLLGNEYSTHNHNQISYYIGFVPGMLNIDPEYLDIYFDNGKVVRVERHRS